MIFKNIIVTKTKIFFPVFNKHIFTRFGKRTASNLLTNFFHLLQQMKSLAVFHQFCQILGIFKTFIHPPFHSLHAERLQHEPALEHVDLKFCINFCILNFCIKLFTER